MKRDLTDSQIKAWIEYFDSLPETTRRSYDACCNCDSCLHVRRGWNEHNSVAEPNGTCALATKAKRAKEKK